VPGEGVEPSRPTRGHLILSQARIASFATPARRNDNYVPGLLADGGIGSGPLPRNASRNARNAFSS
jgi:hypothetical protein